MQTAVVRQFRVKGRSQQVALPDGDDVLLVGPQALNTLAKPGDDRRSNENGAKRGIQDRKLHVRLKAVHLGSEGVAPDGHIEQVQPILVRIVLDFLGHQDHAHTGSPDRHSALRGFDEGGAEAEALHELADRRALAAGNDHAIDAVKVFAALEQADSLLGDAAGQKGAGVALEIALDGDDADTGRHAGIVLAGGRYTPDVIEVIGAPFDLGGRRQGSRLGPQAVRTGGLLEALDAMGLETLDSGDLSLASENGDASGMKHFEAVFSASRQIAEAVMAALEAGRLPLTLGGDHSVALGTLAAAHGKFGNDLAVLWFDAHADLNTPGSTPSGNMHGMVLGAMMGAPSESNGVKAAQWKRLQEELIPHGPIGQDRVAWIGLRDVDPPEAARYNAFRGHFGATMYDIDRYGLVRALERFDAWVREIGVRHLWISFDVDALDPFLAPGTGTAVRGGLTYREMHLAGEMLHELMAAPGCPYHLAGLDLVEIDPLNDARNETARTAIEWIASLFGKTILGKR